MRDLWFSFKLKLLLFSTHNFILLVSFSRCLSVPFNVNGQIIGNVNFSNDFMVNISNNLLTYLNKDLVLVLTVAINVCVLVYV